MNVFRSWLIAARRADGEALPRGKRKTAARSVARGERVDPSTYYFRTTPRFETGHPKYAFLNRLLAVSSGDRRAEGPIYTIDEIL